jgi:hypothetical protein
VDRVDADLEEVVVDADTAPAYEFRRDSGQYLLRGGTRRAVPEPSTSREAGGGRADRSSLPFAESGSASRKTYEDGTIGSGMRSFSQRRRSDVVGPGGVPGTT